MLGIQTQGWLQEMNDGRRRQFPLVVIVHFTIKIFRYDSSTATMGAARGAIPRNGQMGPMFIRPFVLMSSELLF